MNVLELGQGFQNNSASKSARMKGKAKMNILDYVKIASRVLCGLFPVLESLEMEHFVSLKYYSVESIVVSFKNESELNTACYMLIENKFSSNNSVLLEFVSV